MRSMGLVAGLGPRIAVARIGRGLGVRDLSRLSGVSPATISTVERGIHDIGAFNLRHLSVALGVSADYLLGMERGKGA